REAIGRYNEMISKGKSENKAFKSIQNGTRDNARTPFQWSDSENAGFTSGKPWLNITPDYRRFNAEDEANREDSVLNFFKKAIALRKKNKALVYGEFERVENIKAPLYSYYRLYNDEVYYVELNLGKKPAERKLDNSGMHLLLSTKNNTTSILRPYEGNVYRVK
ncbi:MAG: hypothetical protein IJ927_06295, partial [Eubacterium sp.]|nr:hypothetical protein [Eubacterium sp.]